LQKAKTKAPNTPFRRVQGDIHVDSKVADNSFEAKVHMSIHSADLFTSCFLALSKLSF